jgi:DNA-directed RNA polymerase specialized sigma24 family protein
MAAKASLTDEERAALDSVDMNDTSIREFAQQRDVSVAYVHRIRNAAFEKLRNAEIADAFVDKMAELVCAKYGCSYGELIGDDRVGPCVLARTEFFHHLHEFGLSVDEIASRIGMSKDRVSLSISRAVVMCKPFTDMSGITL